MHARTVVITGASDGIGAAAARTLSTQGDKVVVVGRSPDKTRALARELDAPYFLADFARLDDVRELADQLLAWHPRIDVLANNAGGLMGTRETTVDGFEKTFQVNHLAPFLLTNLLRETLCDSRAKVLNTSSVAARLFGSIDLADLNYEEKYSANKAYGDSKLANILFTRELHRRYHSDGISTVAFHPGNVATNFSADSGNVVRAIYRSPLKHLFLVTPDKGARTLLWLANSTPGTDWVSGEFYYKQRVARTNEQADNALLAQQLWDRSAAMVGLAVA
jgi:NAD(P)-dependent dehydrogenase (short-subunit alcohol dehydrogenase family)